jgi:hypothetical protein
VLAAWKGWGGEDNHVLRTGFVPQVHYLVGGLAEVGAVVHLTGEGV